MEAMLTAAAENYTLHQPPIVIPYSQRVATYVIPIIFAIIFVVGVFGNGMLVLIFIRHPVLRNVPNTYILSLALGDLLVIVSSVPFTSTVYTVESWPYGQLICKISECTKDISIGVSVFTLTVLSADRFFAIVDPFNKLHSSIGAGSRRATKFTVLVTAIIWSVSIVCAAPAAVFSYIREFQQDNATLFVVCYPYPAKWMPYYAQAVVIIKFCVYYLIPLTVIACFYVLMARHLIRSTRALPGEAQAQTRQIRARRKVAKTVLAFVVIFAVCFFPINLFQLWFYHHPDAEKSYNEFWHVFRMVGFCLSFSNSCVNPIALYFVSATFRKYFDDYLVYVWCQRNYHNRRYASTTERSNRCCAGTRHCGSTRARSRIGDNATGVGMAGKRLLRAISSTATTDAAVGGHKDRTFWKATSTTSTLQMRMIKSPDMVLNECTLTTTLNGNEFKSHLI